MVAERLHSSVSEPLALRRQDQPAMERAALSPGSPRCNGGQEGFPPPPLSASISLSTEGGAVARGVLLLAEEEVESRHSTSAAEGRAPRGRVAPRKIPIESRRRIVERFQHGVSVSEIAREFGVSECGVRKTWARYATTGSLRDKGAGRPAGRQQCAGAANDATPALEEEVGPLQVSSVTGVVVQWCVSVCVCATSSTWTEPQSMDEPQPAVGGDMSVLSSLPGKLGNGSAGYVGVLVTADCPCKPDGLFGCCLALKVRPAATVHCRTAPVP